MWNEVVFFSFLCFSAVLAINTRWYPKYHQAPTSGWMNDPNGFIIDNKGVIHLFYQYNPKSSTDPGVAHWGHAVSTNFFDWKQLPIAMFPDKEYDKTGVFSGSTLIEGDTAYIYYTGQGRHANGKPNNKQALATTKDFVTFTKYDKNPIITGDEFQPEFRDPKVWKNGGTYYMVLGNAVKDKGQEYVKENGYGQVVLYTSQDKFNWKFASILSKSKGDFGFMWECPDLFPLNKQFVFLFSPQGVDPKGDSYQNLYQTGYILGQFDYKTNQFKPSTPFYEIDHGHDFYATQTTVDKAGRRIMVGWMDMWETGYPEQGDGWTGQMSIPRVLTIKNGKVYQWPVKEINQIKSKVLRTGPAPANTAVRLTNNAAEVVVQAEPGKDFTLLLEDDNKHTVSIAYSASKGTICLDRGGKDPIRRTAWKPRGKLLWTIYIDSSSIELFAGEGEVVFSSRFFPTGAVTVRLSNTSNASVFTVTELNTQAPKTGKVTAPPKKKVAPKRAAQKKANPKKKAAPKQKPAPKKKVAPKRAAQKKANPKKKAAPNQKPAPKKKVAPKRAAQKKANPKKKPSSKKQ